MPSSDPSIYEEILIESNDGSTSVDLRLGVQSIDYYEDIFSPTITLKMVITNTGNTVNGKGIYQGLPLRGGERVSIRIKDKLDFSDRNQYFYVSSITNVISDNQSESFVLNLCSREAITNETARVPVKFPTSSPISVSAEKIIKDYLRTPKTVEVDKTMNKYGFIGNMRKPFTVLTWLASKGVPEVEGTGTAGYCFFETQSGYKFKSLDKLISQEKKETYNATDIVNPDKKAQDYQIIKYVTNKNQNMLEKLRLGAYSSFRAYFNPLNFAFTGPDKGKFRISDYVDSSRNLGGKIELPKFADDPDKSIGDVPTRIMTGIVDLGTVEVGVSTEKNADALEFQSQSLMRYNTLFTQTLTITVACNTDLEAGNVIECLFPATTTQKEKEYDQEQSGLYMIKELCHHFDSAGSYTSAKLVRDTFGQFSPNNKDK